MSPNGNAMPQQIQVMAQITIGLTPDGRVICQYNGPDRKCFLMMMETAKVDLERQLWAKESAAAADPGIEVAPPGSRVLRNGGKHG